MNIKVLASGSKGNCYLLENDNECLIIEAGIPYKDILRGLNFNLNKVVGCIVTHSHMDHAKAVGDLAKYGVDIYASKGTFSPLHLKSHRLKVIKAKEQFRVGGFIILPFSVEHDTDEPLGFLISHVDMGTLLFATDTYYLRYKFKNLNHIMIECNYSNEIVARNTETMGLDPSRNIRLLKSHFSLENVKEFLNSNDLTNVKSIMLLHLSDFNSNAAEFKKDINELTGKKVYVAEKGMMINV